MLQHKMEIYGICFDCLNNRIELMPLVAAKQGERLVIYDFTGGTTSRVRLMTMALRIGDEIEVVTNLGQGQLVIAVAGNRYLLGRGLAEKVLVKPANLTADKTSTENR